MTMDGTVRPGVEISSWVDMKWQRGLQHLTDLQNRISLWDAGGHTWSENTLSDDRKQLTSVLRVEDRPPLAEFSLLLGDAVHNLRSALDSLAWELAHLNDAKPADDRAIAFPLATSPDAWEDNGRRPGWGTKLATIPKVYLDRIRALQPYTADEPKRTMLALLNEMSNQDKHRGMVAARANPSQGRVEFTLDREDLGDTDAEGVMNGFTMRPLSDDIGVLEDGRPFLAFDLSARATLIRERTPVGLAYVVDVEGIDYDLAILMSQLVTLNSYIYYVCGLADLEPVAPSEAP